MTKTDPELAKNISEIIKTFKDNIVITVNEYKDMVQYKEMYYSLRDNYNKDKQHSIDLVNLKYENILCKKDALIKEKDKQIAELQKIIATETNNNKHWWN